MKTKNITDLETKKTKKRDLVLDKNVRKVAGNHAGKKDLAVWGDSSSELEELECPDDAPIVVVQDDTNVFHGLFALMEKCNNEDD